MRNFIASLFGNNKRVNDDSEDLSFSFTVDQDGEDVPVVKCNTCRSQDTECLDRENDLYICGACGNEFIPEIYKELGTADEYVSRGEQNFRERKFKRVIKDSTAAIQLDSGYRKAYLLRGKAHAEREEWQDAENDFSYALRVSPDYDVAFFSRGYVRLHLKNYDGAIEDLTKSINFDPDYAETYNLRAIGYFNKEDYVNAITDFSEVIQRSPDNASAFFQRGYSYSKVDEIEKALGDFNNTLDLDPHNLSAYYRRGEIHEKKKNYREAIDDYLKFLELGGKNSDVAENIADRINRMRAELDPEDTSKLTLEDVEIDDKKEATREGLDLVEQFAQMGLGGQGEKKDDWIKTQKVFYLIGEGENYFSEGRYEEAYESYTEAINFNPAEPTTYIRRSFTAYKLGNIVQALSDLSSAISAEPYHSTLCFLRGAISLIAGKEDDALGDFVEGIHAQFEKDFDRHVLGKLIAENNQLGIAIKDFANEIKPAGNKISQYLIEGALAIIAWADVFSDRNQAVMNALDSFNNVIKLESGCVSAYWCRGFVQQSAEKRIKDYSEAIRLRGNRAIYYLIRGTTKLMEYGIEGFNEDFSKIVELEPENTEAHEKIGLYYLYKEHEYNQAITVFSQGIGRNSKNPNLYYYRGLAYEKQDDSESAIADFVKYIELVENGGRFSIENIKERIETIKTGGNPDNMSEYGDNSLDLGKLLAGLVGASEDSIQEFNVTDDGIELVFQDDVEEDDYSDIVKLNVDNHEKFIDNLSEDDKAEAKTYLLRGVLESAQNKDYMSAIENLTRSIQLNAYDPEARFFRGGQYVFLKNYDKAIDDFSAYFHLHPENPDPEKFSILFTLFHETQDWDKAINVYTDVIGNYPNQAKPYLFRGLAYRNTHNWDAAIIDVSKAIEIDSPENPDPEKFGILYTLFYDTQDWDRAIKVYTEVIGKYPNQAKPYLYRGDAYNNVQNWDAAIIDFSKTIEIDPQYPDPYGNRAYAYEQKMNGTATISDYQMALELGAYSEENIPKIKDRIIQIRQLIDPNDGINEKATLIVEETKLECAKEHTVKAHQFQERSEFEKAIAEYQIAINLAPNYAIPYILLFEIYKEKQEWEIALATVNELVRIAPSDAEALNNRGTVYERMGRLDEAIKDWRAAIQLMPGDPVTYLNLGAAYLVKKELDQAIEYLSKSISLDPNTIRAYAYRGYAYYLNEDYRSTLVDWKKYCALGGEPTYELTIEQIQGYIKALEEQG